MSVFGLYWVILTMCVHIHAYIHALHTNLCCELFLFSFQIVCQCFCFFGIPYLQLRHILIYTYAHTHNKTFTHWYMRSYMHILPWAIYCMLPSAFLGGSVIRPVVRRDIDHPRQPLTYFGMIIRCIRMYVNSYVPSSGNLTPASRIIASFAHPFCQIISSTYEL